MRLCQVSLYGQPPSRFWKYPATKRAQDNFDEISNDTFQERVFDAVSDRIEMWHFFIHAQKRKLTRSTNGKQEIPQNFQHQNNTTMSSSLMYSLSWQHAI